MTSPEAAGQPTIDPPPTDDAFLGGALRLLQPVRGYRAGLDAVLLAAIAVPETDRAMRVLDVGAGVGTAGLCAAWRNKAAQVTLLEREGELVRLAAANIERNGLGERVRVVEADIAATGETLAAAGIAADSFGRVITNPPFHAEGRGTAAPAGLKARAHAMAEGSLDDWARFMARMTAPGGTATLIHKADALAELLAALDRRFGALSVLPVLARAGEPAIRVVVSGIKGSRAPLTLLPPLLVHGPDGEFTPTLQQVLREGAGLPLGPIGS
jgi:tRNA1(Val) A37 N6-methylase TrmN6